MNKAIKVLDEILDWVQEMREEGEHDLRSIIYFIESKKKELKEGDDA